MRALLLSLRVTIDGVLVRDECDGDVRRSYGR